MKKRGVKKGQKMNRRMPKASEGIKPRREYNFKEGNRSWQLRSKHGRDRLFKNAELLRESAEEYFTWCDDNPFIKQQLITLSMGDGMGSYAKLVDVPVRRPYTLEGVCLRMDTNTEYLRQFENGLREDEVDFSRVIKAIRQTVRDQQISNAIAGFFNGNLVSRINSLVDRSDVTTDGEKLSGIPAVNVYNTAPPLAGDEKDVKIKS